MIKNSSTNVLKLTNNEGVFLESTSKFAPKIYKNIKPKGNLI